MDNGDLAAVVFQNWDFDQTYIEIWIEEMKPMKKLEIESSLDKLDGCFSMIVGPKIGDIGFDNDNLGDNSAAWLGRGSSDLHILKGVCFKQSMIPAIYTVISHGILTYFDPWMLG